MEQGRPAMAEPCRKLNWLAAMRFITLLQFVCLCLTVSAGNMAYAEIYRWTDEQGNVHFSDRESSRHASSKVEVRVNTYESVSYDRSILDTGKNVVMYSAEWCGHCKKAKHYFEREGIAYTEHDIEKNAKARAAYKRMGATGVPVILVGKQRMNGFSEKGFEKIYR
jgi:glutaredoxin